MFASLHQNDTSVEEVEKSYRSCVLSPFYVPRTDGSSRKVLFIDRDPEDAQRSDFDDGSLEVKGSMIVFAMLALSRVSAGSLKLAPGSLGCQLSESTKLWDIYKILTYYPCISGGSPEDRSR